MVSNPVPRSEIKGLRLKCKWLLPCCTARVNARKSRARNQVASLQLGVLYTMQNQWNSPSTLSYSNSWSQKTDATVHNTVEHTLTLIPWEVVRDGPTNRRVGPSLHLPSWAMPVGCGGRTAACRAAWGELRGLKETQVRWTANRNLSGPRHCWGPKTSREFKGCRGHRKYPDTEPCKQRPEAN